jgi:hypothetical protein
MVVYGIIETNKSLSFLCQPESGLPCVVIFSHATTAYIKEPCQVGWQPEDCATLPFGKEHQGRGFSEITGIL